MVMRPRSSHRLAPFIWVPIPGMSTRTRPTSTIRYKAGAYLRHAVYLTRLATKKAATPSTMCPMRSNRKSVPTSLYVAGELVEACAPGREQDDVTWPGKLYSSCNGLLQVGDPVDYALEALIFEVSGDAWTRLTLAHDRPAHSQGRQHLREVGVLLRATEDQHYRHVEALQGRCHRGRVGSLGIIHVSHSRHTCRDPHAMRPGLVFEQSLSDLPQLRTQPLCGGRREERVFVVVHPCEAQLGHLCQMRAAK